MSVYMATKYKWKLSGSQYASYLYESDPAKSEIITSSRWPAKSELVDLISGFEGKNFTNKAILDHDPAYKNLILIERNWKIEITLLGEV